MKHIFMIVFVNCSILFANSNMGFDTLPISSPLFFSIIVLMTISTIVALNFWVVPRQNRFLKNYPDENSRGRRIGMDHFLHVNPGFSEAIFFEKVKIGVTSILDTMSNKESKTSLRFISDSLWEELQFRTDFLTRNKNYQHVSRIEIKNCCIDSVYSDGEHDLITVAVELGFLRHTRSETNETAINRYVHTILFVTFTRKKHCVERDMYQISICPSCNAPIAGALEERSVCPFCAVVLNNGYHDWVITALSSAEEFVHHHLNEQTEQRVIERQELLRQLKASSQIELLDIAKLCYIQVMKAVNVFQHENVFCTTPEVLTSARQRYADRPITDFKIVDTTIIAAEITNDVQKLYFEITYSIQSWGSSMKVEMKHIEREILVMEKDSSTVCNPILYKKLCHECGTPFTEEQTTCSQCGAVLNSLGSGWIVTAILTTEQYRNWIDKHDSEVFFASESDLFHSVISVKEYVINNVIAMIGCDNNIDREEIEYLKKVAKKLHYNNRDIEKIIQIAKSAEVPIRMPEDLKMREKIYRVMEKAAQADNKIAIEERELLDFVKRTYLTVEK